MAIRNKKPNRNGLVKSEGSKLRYENKELKERIEALEKQLSIHGVVKQSEQLKKVYSQEFEEWYDNYLKDPRCGLYDERGNKIRDKDILYKDYNKPKRSLF